MTAMWGGLRGRYVVSALRARSFVGVVFTTPMVFFTHHRLVTRPIGRKIMDAAQGFIEKELAMLSKIGLAAAPQLETTKQRIFSGLRAKGFAEATQRDSWGLVEHFLRAAAPVMLATHARNPD
jgi:hypothetical protein